MRRLASALGLALIAVGPLQAQDPLWQVTVTSPRGEASVTLGFSDGTTLTASLDDGRFVVAGHVIATVEPDAEFGPAWLEFVASLWDMDAAEVLEALREWSPPEVAGFEASAFREAYAAALRSPSADVSPIAPTVTLIPKADRSRGILALHGEVEVAKGQVVHGGIFAADGDVEIAGRVEGDVVALRGDVLLRRQAVVEGDVVAVEGQITNRGATVGGREWSRSLRPERSLSAVARTWDHLVSVVGVFLALGALGLGLSSFAPRQLETSSETVSASLGRSFVVGLLGQVLFLPTLVMLIVGLAITVIGVIAIPFAVLAAVLIGVLGSVGGFLAVARTVGETVARRRMAAGASVLGTGNLAFIVMGLGAFSAMWLGAAIFTWVPVAGPVFWSAASIITWVAITTGFGAALLSRFGFREVFAGRVAPQVTDEYLWPTPIGTPAAKVERGPRREDS